MRESESNSTRPSTSMWPRSGVTMPAMHLSVMLLPLPEAPSRASVSFSAANAIFSVKPGSRFSMSTTRDIYTAPFRRSSRFTARSTAAEMATFTSTHRSAIASLSVRHS